jgi:hypothetical protein
MEMLVGGAMLMMVGTISGEWSRLDIGAITAFVMGLAY